MAKLTNKQIKIINALLKLNSSIQDLKKLTSIEYTDFFKVLVNENIDLYKNLTTAENLDLLDLTLNDIEQVKAEKSAKAKLKLEKAREVKKNKIVN